MKYFVITDNETVKKFVKERSKYMVIDLDEDIYLDKRINPEIDVVYMGVKCVETPLEVALNSSVAIMEKSNNELINKAREFMLPIKNEFKEFNLIRIGE